MSIPSLLSLNYTTQEAAKQASRGRAVKNKYKAIDASDSNPFGLDDALKMFKTLVCVWMRAVYLPSGGELCMSPRPHV